MASSPTGFHTGRIDELFFTDWVRRVLATGPLTPVERSAIEDAIRRCYATAGMEPPESIVWLDSPSTAAAAAVTAAADLLPRPSPEQSRRAAASQWRRWFARASAYVAGMMILGSAASLYILGLITREPRDTAWTWIPGAAVGLLWGVFRCSTHSWPDWRFHAEVHREGRESQQAADELRAVIDRIREACVGTRPDWAPAVALMKRIEEAVAGLRWTLLRDVYAINDAVRRVTGQPPGRRVTTSPGLAGCDVFTDVDIYWRLERGDDFPEERRRVLQDWAEAGRVTWWPHPRFATVCEPPTELHLETLPGGERRPHRADGPAIRWGDELALWFWHGVSVPESLIDPGWQIWEIHDAWNSEIQRAAIERMGWLTYLDRAGLELIASTPDPANPPHNLLLYADTSGRMDHARILVMTNGSPNRSGAEMRYAEPVPARFDDPVEAAAWQYDVPIELYRNLARRT